MLGTLDERAIEAVLKSGVIGRLGLITTDGRPYVVPITYAYDDHAIIGHSAAGEKLAALRASRSVCFEVEDVTDLGNWQSVIGWGQFEELAGDDAKAAIELLVARVAPLMAMVAGEGHGSAHPHGHSGDGEAVLFRIRLDERTGRFETRP